METKWLALKKVPPPKFLHLIDLLYKKTFFFKRFLIYRGLKIYRNTVLFTPNLFCEILYYGA